MASIISDIIFRIKQYSIKHKKLVIMIVLSLLTGITLFGQVIFYEIWLDQNINNSTIDSGMDITPNFDRGKRYVRFIIPILYSDRTYESPYKYKMAISGEFDSVKNVQAKFIINDSEVINIPIIDEELNTGKKEYIGKNVFWTNERKLNVKVRNVKTIRLVVELDGINGTSSNHFKSEKNYKIGKKPRSSFILAEIIAFLLVLFGGGP